MGLLVELGIDVQRFYKAYDRKLYSRLGTAIFYDRATFGDDRIVPGMGKTPWPEFLVNSPLSENVRRDIARVYTAERRARADLAARRRRTSPSASRKRSAARASRRSPSPAGCRCRAPPGRRRSSSAPQTRPPAVGVTIVQSLHHPPGAAMARSMRRCSASPIARWNATAASPHETPMTIVSAKRRCASVGTKRSSTRSQ